MTKLYIAIFKDEDPVTTVGNHYSWLNSNKNWAEHQAEMQKKYRETHHPNITNEYEIYEVTIKKARKK